MYFWSTWGKICCIVKPAMSFCLFSMYIQLDCVVLPNEMCIWHVRHSCLHFLSHCHQLQCDLFNIYFWIFFFKLETTDNITHKNWARYVHVRVYTFEFVFHLLLWSISVLHKSFFTHERKKSCCLCYVCRFFHMKIKNQIK